MPNKTRVTNATAAVNAEEMKIYSAPMQGFTDVVWRSAHHDIFGGVDAYYGSFLRLEHGQLRRHDLRDIDPADNAGVPFTPQALGSAQAPAVAVMLRDMGYDVVDINLGCPHPPIALKHKGSGLLPYPDELAAMVDALAAVDGVRYTVKMRLGWDDPTQWRQALPVIERLNPLHITIHPRTGRQLYRGELHMDQLDCFADECHSPIVYNGDIHTADDVDTVARRLPRLAGVMVGRALLACPALFSPDKATPADMQRFHDRLMDGYSRRLTGGEHQLLTKMQSLWQFFLPDTPHRLLKAIAKARTLNAYRDAAAAALSL